MRQNRNSQSFKEGHLPAMAPLANPYVPFQLENPPQYTARKGLIRGTMHPGLDLPFKNQVNQKEFAVNAMTELQAIAFAIQDLTLYMDTHRDDREVLMLLREYQKMYEVCKEKHVRKYGAMNNTVPGNQDTYEWLDDPWPWEYSKNKGV